MTISKSILSSIESSSWIRKMFEEGAKRKALYGADKVFDLSIGNPVFEPPEEVTNSLIRLLKETGPGSHRYMPNAGYYESREYIAETLEEETGLPFTSKDIVMTVGAGGGLNVVMKSLLDPGDEVIVLVPYFVEYDAYIENHQGKVIQVQTNEDFSLDIQEIEEAITERTKAILINAPNNPTGVVYPEEDLRELGLMLERKNEEYSITITLVSDEPYRYISYIEKVPSLFLVYDHVVVVTSYSKDLAIPGERIGYLAISPRHFYREQLEAGTVIALRILGFVNAPALMQRMLPLVKDARVDLGVYKTNRELLCFELERMGYQLVRPDGAFYLFPKSPLEDDLEFIKRAQEKNLLLVPGTAFGRPGYFRVAYCFETELIERALPIFEDLIKEA